VRVQLFDGSKKLVIFVLGEICSRNQLQCPQLMSVVNLKDGLDGEYVIAREDRISFSYRVFLFTFPVLIISVDQISYSRVLNVRMWFLQTEKTSNVFLRYFKFVAQTSAEFFLICGCGCGCSVWLGWIRFNVLGLHSL